MTALLIVKTDGSSSGIFERAAAHSPGDRSMAARNSALPATCSDLIDHTISQSNQQCLAQVSLTSLLKITHSDPRLHWQYAVDGSSH